MEKLTRGDGEPDLRFESVPDFCHRKLKKLVLSVILWTKRYVTSHVEIF